MGTSQTAAAVRRMTPWALFRPQVMVRKVEPWNCIRWVACRTFMSSRTWTKVKTRVKTSRLTRVRILGDLRALR